MKTPKRGLQSPRSAATRMPQPPSQTRFRTYQVDLGAFGDTDGTAVAYSRRLLGRPEFLAWEAGA